MCSTMKCVLYLSGVLWAWAIFITLRFFITIRDGIGCQNNKEQQINNFTHKVHGHTSGQVPRPDALTVKFGTVIGDLAITSPGIKIPET